MYVVYVYPNDGTETVTLSTHKRRNAALRSIVERTASTDVKLSPYPKGKVVIRSVFLNGEGDTASHVIRSWDVAKLAPVRDHRDSAQGTGSVKAYGVNSKGRVSGRVFRSNGLLDTIGAQACLSKHPVCEGRYPSTRSHSFVHLREDTPHRMADNA